MHYPGVWARAGVEAGKGERLPSRSWDPAPRVTVLRCEPRLQCRGVQTPLSGRQGFPWEGLGAEGAVDGRPHLW